ncbi:MAG: HEAT repeat domain-containing protein [Desulfosarcina sp.]|nr:HEAT repeat domain-containing protein [Desulfosarcina sp.]
MMGNRELKARIRQLLEQDDFQNALETILRIPGRQAVNPLFSFFYSGEEQFRWRAVTAMGAVVCHMADTSMESARVVMRRIMWNLNDESGGIGWGSPEAMGEITAGHAGLADEFACIVVSYINPDGNFLEHEMLQRGSLWAVGRLPDPFLRGTAAWAAGPIVNDALAPLLKALQPDDAPLRLYRQRQITETTVGSLAKAALAAGTR